MKKARGFTLLEMLVALSIAALVISLVYGTVRIGSRSVQAIDLQLDRNEAMRIGWQFLRDALSRARPVPDPNDNNDPTSFSGSNDRLAFVADMPAYLGLGGLMKITVEVENNVEGQQLILSRQRFDSIEGAPAALDENSTQRAVIVEDLQEISIEYLGASEDQEASLWTSYWDEPTALPTLVRVDITPVGAQAWPQITAAPIAAGFTSRNEAEEDDHSIPEETTLIREAEPNH